MGYTHYFKQAEKLKVSQIQRDLIRGILDENENVLAGWDGNGKPEFTKSKLSFNGLASKDQDHETFIVEFGEKSDFSFCKTARKEYDLAVCECLLVLSLSKGFSFNSDGVGTMPSGQQVLDDGRWGDALKWFADKGYKDTINKKIIPNINKD